MSDYVKRMKEIQTQVNKLMDLLMIDLPPRIYLFKICHIVNVFKGGMLPYILFLMRYYKNYREEMCLYMIMHGSYGLLWLARHFTQPDASFDRYQTITCSILSCVAILIPYCVPAFLLASGRCDKQLVTDWTLNDKVIVSVFWRKYLALLTYIMGVALTMCADVQKNTHLKHVKERPILIQDGIFSICRNANYLGEIMLYGAFAMMTNHWLSYAIVVYAWCTILLARIIQKELSLRQKPGWKEYEARSNYILPKILGLSDIKIAAIFAAAVVAYSKI